MFTALSFHDILQEERDRVTQEVNHCHGPGRGHPCDYPGYYRTPEEAKRMEAIHRSKGGERVRQQIASGKPDTFKGRRTFRPKRLWPFGVKLPYASQTRETWSDASRAAAIAARRAKAGAQQLSKTADEKVQAGKAADANLRGGLAVRRQAKDAEAKKAAAAAKSSGSKAATAEKKATSEKFDAQITAAAKNLKALAAKGTDTPEYEKAYAAYKDLQDQKREALGGAPSVKAPSKPKAAPKGAGTRAQFQSQMDKVNAERNGLMGRQLSDAEQARADELDTQWDALKKKRDAAKR